MQTPFLNTSDEVEVAGSHPPLLDKILEKCDKVISDEGDK